MAGFNPFDTKARVVLVFDPDHLQKIDQAQVARIVEVAIEFAKIPGFRGCLPCADSGFGELPFRMVSSLAAKAALPTHAQ